MEMCKHCDVNAYYKVTIEDFNISEPWCLDLCIKCIKDEIKKIVENFPAIKSLKIEPLLPSVIAGQ
jgi:hypothetical protein